jgi:phenylalanyl-tRNA synthetase alpha chain
MLSDLTALHTEALAALDAATDETSLETLRIDYLGKKGKLTALSAGMKEVPPDLKKDVGAKLNEVRTAITDGIASRATAF